MADKFKILVTCPPMLNMMDDLLPSFSALPVELTRPKVTQVLTEAELKQLVPLHDGWIIGDDPATRDVFTTGRAGRLRAAIRWGIGVDNVDFAACKDLGIPITNTPGMFGNEVADVAMGYVIALARQTFLIDREVRAGHWAKPRGISLSGKTCAILGYGDIGRNVATRVAAAGMLPVIFDPGVSESSVVAPARLKRWPDGLGDADFLVITCALTPSSRQLVNSVSLKAMKRGIRVVNVARGPIVDEGALVEALRSGHVHSAALDVFEVEPLPPLSPLREFERCIFGSHNGSNTAEAVARTSEIALTKLLGFLGKP
jgi:D-3-phosphoglycerate dehydrogenase